MTRFHPFLFADAENSKYLCLLMRSCCFHFNGNDLKLSQKTTYATVMFPEKYIYIYMIGFIPEGSFPKWSLTLGGNIIVQALRALAKNLSITRGPITNLGKNSWDLIPFLK